MKLKEYEKFIEELEQECGMETENVDNAICKVLDIAEVWERQYPDMMANLENVVKIILNDGCF